VREYAWVAFTSRNGVDAFFDRLTASGKDARALGDVRVAAIGPATAARLVALGVRPDFVPSSAVGEAIAQGLVEHTAAGDRVLLYRAQEGRDVIPETLSANGRHVDDIAAYKTVAIHDTAIAEAAHHTDMWTFTSASTVRAFVANVPDAAALASRVEIACIGPVTAAAARELGLRVDVVADEFTVDGLIDAMESSATPSA
jgi:uroporphyrinogen-III synthase